MRWTLQALNVLMLKILENSNRNFTFSALLSLLLDTPTELTGGLVAAPGAPQQLQQARWADLVVKCLIKSTKALPQIIEVRTSMPCRAAGNAMQSKMVSIKLVPQCVGCTTGWRVLLLPLLYTTDSFSSPFTRPKHRSTCWPWSALKMMLLQRHVTCALPHTVPHRAACVVSVQSIDLYSLLLSIHGFFESLGVDEIRRRSQADDKPLRMVKTILHELCKLKGTEIYRWGCWYRLHAILAVCIAQLICGITASLPGRVSQAQCHGHKTDLSYANAMTKTHGRDKM